MKGDIVNGEKIIDQEVAEYFREFTKRGYTQADLARRSGFSSASICYFLANGNCSRKMKSALEYVYKNPLGNYTNTTIQDRLQNNTVIQDQSMKRIECYKQKIQKSMAEYENSLINLIEANKKDFLKLCIDVKKKERKFQKVICHDWFHIKGL